jgi:hypothetical protein
VYYECEGSTTRYQYYGGSSWSTTGDNGYVKNIKCYGAIEESEQTTEAPGLGLWLDDNDQVRYDDGFVCDDSFSQESADMVCTVVNGAGSVATTLEMSVDLIGCDAEGDAHITLDDVICSAGAMSLSDCTSTTSENCACSEGIIVVCDETTTTAEPTTTEATSYVAPDCCECVQAESPHWGTVPAQCSGDQQYGDYASFCYVADTAACEAKMASGSIDGAYWAYCEVEEEGDSEPNCEIDCDGVVGGSAEEDECGVCNGDNTACADCAGVPNGDAQVDECGVCNGDNSECADCAGVPNGNAQEDACGVCNGNNACLTTTAGPETTEEEITCASFGSDKKGCKKTSKDYGLKCKWQKHTSPKMCTNKDWIPVCAEYTDNKKSCKKLGCDWDKVTGICSGLEVCEEEDMTWGEVSGIVQTTGKVKHKFVASVEECMATADALGAVAIIYEQYNPKQLCFTYTGIGGYAAGSSADSEFVTYAKDCY